MLRTRAGLALAACAALTLPLAGCGASNPCTPFNSCDAAVDLILNTFAGDGLNELCTEWNSLSRAQQRELVDQITGATGEGGDIREIGFFINPTQAAIGLTESFTAKLQQECR